MKQTEYSFLNGQKLGWFIFESVMAALYLIFGAIFLFTPLFNHVINGTWKLALGILLGLYGIFRIFRVIRKLLQKTNK